MKTFIINFLLALFVASATTSCTVIKITNSYNGNQIETPCHVLGEFHCVSYDGVEITVKGGSCDYSDFINSGMNKNVLLERGYILSNDKNDTVLFHHPRYF